MSTLYLKEEPVIQIKDIKGRPSEFVKVINPELLPVCLRDNCTTESLFKWLDSRKMPQNREGLQSVIDEFGQEWQTANKFALSLTDHYWILATEQKKWSQINFFTNRYAPGIGDMFFSPWKINTTRFDASPDLTTGGILKKRWKQKDDRTSYLVKAGSQITHQEPLSEVLVSVFCEKLKKIECVKYELCVEGVVMCSKCDNFVTVNTDFVPASEVYIHEKRKEGESVFEHLLRMCEFYDIPNAENYLRWLVFVDRVTGNEDRNLGNIGFLRDIKTMKFIGPAPLFDSGNAYLDSEFINKKMISKCFKEDEKRIFNELKKEVDLSILEDGSYENLILKYPEISDKHKENLIKLISGRYNEIMDKSKKQKKELER